MVCENRRTTIDIEGGLHQVVVDENSKTPKIEVDLGAGMSNEEYREWNLIGAIRRIRESPREKDIYVQVYKIHIGVLQKRGMSEEDLQESDRLLKEYTGVEI